LEVQLRDAEGMRLVSADVTNQPEPVHLEPGLNHLEFRIDAVHLNPGPCTLGLWMADHSGNSTDYIPAVLRFEVVPDEGRHRHQDRRDALIPCRFTVRRVEETPHLGSIATEG
jgi:hypothetical protein